MLDCKPRGRGFIVLNGKMLRDSCPTCTTVPPSNSNILSTRILNCRFEDLETTTRLHIPRLRKIKSLTHHTHRLLLMMQYHPTVHLAHCKQAKQCPKISFPFINFLLAYQLRNFSKCIPEYVYIGKQLDQPDCMIYMCQYSGTRWCSDMFCAL